MRTVRRGTVSLAMLIGLVVSVPSASADVLVLANGRTLTVRKHSIDGGAITVILPSGGIATFERDLVSRIEAEAIAVDDEEAVAPTAVSSASQPLSMPEPTIGAPPPFAALIDEVAGRHGVDPGLVHSVVRAESNYQPRARSARGARGLMQVLPSTGAALGARKLYDPSTNLDAGVRYLKGLLAEFTLPEALAAYNAGPQTVRRFGGIPPFLETQRYVERVLSNFRRYPR